jgi:hypothetical protein
MRHRRLLSSECAAPAPVNAAPVPAPGAEKTPRQECHELVNVLLPLAQKWLREHHGFLPYGAGMAPSGQIVLTMAPAGQSDDVNTRVGMMELAFRQAAAEGQFKATALVVDMIVIPPGKSAKQDGVAIRLDHRAGYSVILGYPYAFSASGELVMETPFTSEGAHAVFPPK